MSGGQVSDTAEGTRESSGTAADELREEVRRRYAAAARAVTSTDGSAEGTGGTGCCDPGATPAAVAVDDVFGATLYAADDADAVPADALLASLGCGNPTAVAELRDGEVVLDLGSGGGIDVILSAHRVGPSGRAYGVDMTDEMLDLARRNVAAAGVTNAEILRGTIEAVPLPDASVDVVISNCVVNLSTDKPAVFAEVARLLRPGGRVGVSDVVAEDRLSPAQRAERGDHAGCIAGALSVSEYEQGLREAGLVDVSVTFTHEVADGLHGAIVRATRPA